RASPIGGRSAHAGVSVHAELVALRVQHHGPGPAGLPYMPLHARAEPLEPCDLPLAAPLAGVQVEVEAVLDRLLLRDPLEEQPPAEPGAAGLVDGVVRVPYRDQ